MGYINQLKNIKLGPYMVSTIEARHVSRPLGLFKNVCVSYCVEKNRKIDQTAVANTNSLVQPMR